MFVAQTEVLARAMLARDRATEWLKGQVAADGKPGDSEDRNGWMRLPWGLAICGRSEIGAAAARWVEINQLQPGGAFKPFPLTGQAYVEQYPHYWLGTFVVGAWLVGRQDLALRSMRWLASAQSPSGGMPMLLPGANGQPVDDILSTGQVGLAALVCGAHDVAHKCADWMMRIAEQNAAETMTFYACMQGADLCTEPDPSANWASVIRFDQPRQAYYPPGMGAVFLANYARIHDHPQALQAARRLLAFNMRGHEAQFTDIASVQACKFGWAVGEMHLTDPDGGWYLWVERMTEWFIQRQAPDGSWGPSRFSDTEPTLADRMIKTAEHVMELTVLMRALASEQNSSR
ncbi:hypothetical protein [Novosphingobium rosa]|uniref:hypothetical protein n=1 Tax=Novosphingobium rosa TaxID=76978 RepID=UPI00082CF6E2|nr:hypothetical protein [Novosphingobium rosa]